MADKGYYIYLSDLLTIYIKFSILSKEFSFSHSCVLGIKRLLRIYIYIYNNYNFFFFK